MILQKEKIFFYSAVLLMFLLLLFIVFGDQGWMEFRRLKADRNSLMEKNDRLKKENLLLYKEIERLKNDPEYIENVARQEYGMVGKDEVVVKLRKAGEKDP